MQGAEAQVRDLARLSRFGEELFAAPFADAGNRIKVSFEGLGRRTEGCSPDSDATAAEDGTESQLLAWKINNAQARHTLRNLKKGRRQDPARQALRRTELTRTAPVLVSARGAEDFDPEREPLLGVLRHEVPRPNVSGADVTWGVPNLRQHATSHLRSKATHSRPTPAPAPCASFPP